MKRREFLRVSAGVAAVAALSPPARAQADRFFKLGLILRPVVVRDAVWKPVQT